MAFAVTCLLCPSPAVADALCVPCGAKLWAAKEWLYGAPDTFLRIAGKLAAGTLAPERVAALDCITSGAEAMDFLVSLEAAKALRLAQTKSCPECGRMVPRDEHKENCGRKT